MSSASVNLTTETAVVWPVSDAKSVPDWQKTVGTELAKHLTSCGFQSNLRGKVFLQVHCSFVALYLSLLPLFLLISI